MPILLALLSACSYGVSDYVGGRSSRRSPPIAIAATGEIVLLVGFLTMVPLVESTGPDARAVGWGVAAGLAGGIGQVCLYIALARGNMAVVAPVTGVVAAVLPVTVGLLLGERPGSLALVGIVSAVVAIALIGGAVGAVQQHPALSTVLLAILVGAAFGSLFVAYSRAGDDAGTWPLLMARLGSVPLLGSVYALRRWRGRVPWPNAPIVRAGAAVGVLGGTAHVFYLFAVQRGLLSIVAVIVSLYPASTVALAAALDGERVSRWQALGMAIAVVAVVLVTLAS